MAQIALCYDCYSPRARSQVSSSCWACNAAPWQHVLLAFLSPVDYFSHDASLSCFPKMVRPSKGQPCHWPLDHLQPLAPVLGNGTPKWGTQRLSGQSYWQNWKTPIFRHPVPMVLTRTDIHPWPQYVSCETLLGHKKRMESCLLATKWMQQGIIMLYEPSLASKIQTLLWQ